MAERIRHDAFSALREKNYRLFVGGWLPASIGLQMQATAIAWEVYERTRDPLALGIVGLARALPTVLLALPAGQIIDLVDRRRVLVGTQVGFAVSALLLACGSIAWESGAFASAAAGLAVMYALVALSGFARVFNGPGRTSLLPHLFRNGAEDEVFQNAVAWNSSVFHLAAVLGPLAAGALIVIFKSPWPVYVISAVSCLGFAITTCFIRPYSDPRSAAPAGAGSPIESQGDVARADSAVRFWQRVRPAALLPGMLEGVRHIWRDRVLLGAIALDLMAVLLGGATALMPIYASDILHVGPIGLGALRAAPFVGAFVTGVALAHRRPFERAGAALLWSIAGFGACTITFGFSTSLWLSLIMLALLGALDGVSVVIRHVLVAVRTPDRLRGRVSSVNGMFIECSNELGGFESGLVAKFFGPVVSAVSGGIGTLLVVGAVALCIPSLRRLGRIAVVPDEGALEEERKPT